MSAPDPAADGTFQILDHLPEDVRQLYIQKLAKEELAGIVAAMWRERDANMKGNDADLDNAAEEAVATGQSVQVPALREPGREEIAAAETSPIVDTPASAAKDIRREKRSAEPSLSSGKGSAKRRKAVEMESTRWGAELDTEADVQRSNTEVINAHEVKAAEPKVDKTFTGTKTSTLSSTDSDHLPFMIYIPRETGRWHWASIAQLPTDVHGELIKRFDGFREETNTRLAKYHKLSRNPNEYVNELDCVNNAIWEYTELLGRGQPCQLFNFGGKLRKSADDWCVIRGLPCLHIIKQDGSYAFGIVPLPTESRPTDDWRRLDFWVVDHA